MRRSDQLAIQNLFIQSITENDNVLLKTIMESMKFSRSLHFKELLQIKNELGGFTPLQFVCFQGNSTIASMLINTGSIDINEKGEFDWTALHAAVYSGDFNTVQLLLNSCADCFARDENNNLPIDYSNSNDIYNFIKFYMKEKNLDLFNKLSKDLDNIQPVKKQDRSKSCFAQISALQIRNIREQFQYRLYSDTDSNELLNKTIMRKWKTYSDLSIEMF